MDINAHVTFDETPAMINSIDALCEAVGMLVHLQDAVSINTEEIPDEIKAAAQEGPSITVPTQEVSEP